MGLVFALLLIGPPLGVAVYELLRMRGTRPLGERKSPRENEESRPLAGAALFVARPLIRLQLT